MPTLTRGHAKSLVIDTAKSQYILVINTKKNNQVWARLTDDRVARDDRGRHIECGVNDEMNGHWKPCIINVEVRI